MNGPLTALRAAFSGSIGEDGVSEMVNQALDFLSNEWTPHNDLLHEDKQPFLQPQLVPGLRGRMGVVEYVQAETAFASLYEGLRHEFLCQRVDLLVHQVGELPYVFDHLRGNQIVLRYASDNLPPHPRR
jgi:hypothetical protein